MVKKKSAKKKAGPFQLTLYLPDTGSVPATHISAGHRDAVGSVWLAITATSGEGKVWWHDWWPQLLQEHSLLSAPLAYSKRWLLATTNLPPVGNPLFLSIRAALHGFISRPETGITVSRNFWWWHVDWYYCQNFQLENPWLNYAMTLNFNASVK